MSGSEIKPEVGLTTAILEGMASGGAGLAEALAELAEDIYFKVEVQLFKAAVGSGNEKVTSSYKSTSLSCLMLKVIDDVMGLRERFCRDDDIAKHRRDFDWLLEAVTKVTHCHGL